MTARQQAVSDIKDTLKQQGKCFIAFRKDLNPVMRKITKEYLHSQKTIK